MLHHDTDERLSIEKILIHPWMIQTNEEDEEEENEEEEVEDVEEKKVEETKTNKTKIIKKQNSKPKPKPKNLGTQQKKKSPTMGASDEKEG